jgi:hypothetical protein
MFDNGSFLRRRKRYKRVQLHPNLPFGNMFGPFHPFWIRKPVPVIPSIQFPPSMHHPSASSHPPIAHHQSHCVPFNFINFRNTNHAITQQSMEPDERKVSVSAHKKEYFDSATIQSIKNELFSGGNNNNNNVSSASDSLQQAQTSAVVANSYEDEDFNNDNIDVETDSDNDQQLCELKQSNYHNLNDASAIKSEEWSKIMKNTMMIKSNQIEQLIASANDASLSPAPMPSSGENQQKIEKRILPTDDEDSEYLQEPFTEHSLLNLSDKKKGKFGNTKGFSIENLIGRMVEDR